MPNRAKKIYITPYAVNVCHHVSEHGSHHRSQMKPTYVTNFESIASQQFNVPHFIVQTQSTNFEILSSSSYRLKIFLHLQMAHVCVCVCLHI